MADQVGTIGGQTIVEQEQPQQEEFNLSDKLYTLDESDQVDLPTGSKAVIHEMTGNEQRNFLNKGKQLSGVALQELLSACVESIDDNPLPANPQDRTKFLLDLLSGDRATLVFQIRRYSLGNDFRFSARCPNQECKKEDIWEVDLSNTEDFPVKSYPQGKQKVLEYESKVRAGLKFRYTQLDGHAEMTLFRKRASLNALTDLELRQPHAYDPGQQRWVPVMLQKLPEVIISEMREFIRRNEGSIRTSVDVQCKNCDSTVTFDLLTVQDFMFPSVTS